MKKFIIPIIFALLAGGCAATNQYSGIYNEAVAGGRSVTIIKEGELTSIRSKINEHLQANKYTKVLYSDPEQGFLVTFKDIPLAQSMLIGDPHTYRIILKYTKAGEGKTRIDLVNGNPGLMIKGDIDQDIAKIADLIRAD